MDTLTPHSLRAARGFLDWSRRDLVKHSGVARDTIAAIEDVAGEPSRRVRPETMARLVATFAAHGVEVLPPPRDGARRIPRE